MSVPTGTKSGFKNKEKPLEVRKSNILAARAVADAIRTSLGPKGMDKMIQTARGQVIISNDGNTILQHMAVMHPAAKMLVDLSASQDSVAGDGTTSVVILAGSLLGAADKLLKKGIHPSIIAENFQKAAQRAAEVVMDMSKPIELSDRETLIRAASTSLNSKIVSQFSSTLAPMLVDAALQAAKKTSNGGLTLDLNDIRIIKSLGGTIEDTTLANGLVLNNYAVKNAGGPSRMEKAKIGLIQFQLSAPKPDMENHIVVNDYRQMDKILKEERQYILGLAKAIKKSKCNVLLIQKSILRDAVSELALHFLAKLNIMVIKDIERDDIEFISRSTGAKPVADIEAFTEDKLGSCDLVEEVESSGSKTVRFSSREGSNTVSILVRGANDLVIDETERSLHDALCVLRSLFRVPALVPGGGACEVQVAQVIGKESRAMDGASAICYEEFSNAMLVIPTTLAENAGLNPVNVVTELRVRHEKGEVNAGISVRRGTSIMVEEHVIQPALVTTSAITLAAECAKGLLRIDDIAFSR
ncbi:T-complex protein 1 subunit delta [Yarrowia sp. C11]|nr:T-complex protein 1 subunit delta [Yarrowia sp. C11]KAG5364176.1 T-complex protein 1 subunit delta [Yarrowia sp. E02]